MGHGFCTCCCEPREYGFLRDEYGMCSECDNFTVIPLDDEYANDPAVMLFRESLIFEALERQAEIMQRMAEEDEMRDSYASLDEDLDEPSDDQDEYQ